MDNLVNINSLMRISKFAKQLDRSPAWVHKLGHENEIDLIEIDGYWFVKVNEKSVKHLNKVK